MEDREGYTMKKSHCWRLSRVKAFRGFGAGLIGGTRVGILVTM